MVTETKKTQFGINAYRQCHYPLPLLQLPTLKIKKKMWKTIYVN